MRHDTVLLLGGGGFIGAALAKRLQLEKIPVFTIGRGNAELLSKTLPQCNTVVHLASTTTPGSSAIHPQLELANITLTLSLLELLQRQPQTHLIFFSSGGTVYGNPKQLPVAVSDPTVPLSYHGAGKLAQEVFCNALRAHGSPVTILRPSNAYGPGQTLRDGFGLIRTMLEHLRQGTSLEIWGDGESVRDYIYIDDIVEATLRLIKSPGDSGTYNLGSGMGYSVNQVKSVVEATCGYTLQTVYRPARSVDVSKVVLDTSRLRTQIGWHASVDLSKGVLNTWNAL